MLRSAVTSIGVAPSCSPRCMPAAACASRCSKLRKTVSHLLTVCDAAKPHLNASFALTLDAPALRTASSHPPSNSPNSGDHKLYDLLGLGQAMCDFSAAVDEEVLSQAGVKKGGRRVVTLRERAQVMSTLDEAGCESSISPGGSLANTLVAVARLGRSTNKQLRVGMAGSMGVDTLGTYFNAQMSQSGVAILLDEQSGNTGTVITLTTPDAQRSFLSFFTSGEMHLTESVKSAIRCSRVLVIEGYLWETPNAFAYIRSAAALARESGAQVVLTAGDPGVVQRHRNEILQVIEDGVDVLFTNMDEAQNLICGDVSGARQQQVMDAREAALKLGTMCSVAVVTDGSKGAYITAMGQLHVIPPHWTPHGPVDTCGAGDAFAAGVLFSLLSGYDCRAAGLFGARVASAVISRYGPQLLHDDADKLAEALPKHTLPAWPSLASPAAVNWMRASFDGC